MKRLFALALTLIPCGAFAQSQLSQKDAAVLQAGLTVTADAFILPSYQQQKTAAEALVNALTTFCKGDADIVPAHDAYADLFLAWQRSSSIQIGPITQAEGPMRVQLWPDPKGFSRRAVLATKRDENPALLEQDGLKERSIALVNLSALERLLYQDLFAQTYSCDLSVAIARYQLGLASDLVDAWSPGHAFRHDYDNAHTGNATYENLDAVIRELLAGLVVYTDRIRKFKIQRGLGAQQGDAREERTEARLSGLGRQSIAESHKALHDLYEIPFGFFDVTPDVGGLMEYFVLGETAGNVADALYLEDRTLVEIATADGPTAQQIRQYGDLMLYHEQYLKDGLTTSIGMTSGFTSADGD